MARRARAHAYIASTVDGFIARPDDRIDWLEHDAQGDDYGYAAFRASIDSLVLGRRTYEQVLGFGVDWPYQGLRAVIWSRELTTADLPADLRAHGVEASALAPADLLAHLGAQGLTDTWIDGGQTLQTFLAQGCLDTLCVTRLPRLIGQGRRLFGALPADVHLAHTQTRAFPSGVVQSTYRVGLARD